MLFEVKLRKKPVSLAPIFHQEKQNVCRVFQTIHRNSREESESFISTAGRELNPMLRIIEYLRLLGLRPLELMKSFDKTSSFELPRKEFIDQIKASTKCVIMCVFNWEKIGNISHPYFEPV